jgi:signal transduction histidine kinase/ActR/RegA family two-component response regulator
MKEHDQLIDGIADPVLVLDRERAIVDLNLAALRLAGNPDSWRGARADTLFPFLAGLSVTGADRQSPTIVEVASHSYELRASRVRVGAGAWLVMLRDVSTPRRLAAEREEFVRRSSELIASVSQELRTPVAAVQGALQLVLAGKALTPDDRRMLTAALRSCEHLARIAHEILDISTIEAARPVPGPQPFAAERLVLDALFDVARHAAEKNIRIENGVARDLPLVIGNYDQLVEALVNVLLHAIADAPEGSTVGIGGVQTGDAVGIAVHDAGPGVAPDPISAALVAHQRGRIVIDRPQGGGTTVSLYLPQAPLQTRQARGTATVATARILVADDDPDLRDIVTEALESSGFSVIAAEDGQRALELLAQEHVDLAVLDFNMPNVRGDEVIRSVRSGERQPHLPIVMLTGSFDERHVPAGLGADVLLTKPADLRRLVREIHSLLGRMSDGRQTGT